MSKKILILTVILCLVVIGFGCAKKQTETNPGSNLTQNQMPSNNVTPAKPINGQEIADKVNKTLDGKFPGEWAVSGTILKKGSYTENGAYQMVTEIGNIYPGSMVSIFVGETRISGTIKGADGKPVLSGYPTPPDVSKTMASGKLTVADAGAMGSSSFQKLYLPIKAGDKTIAVMTISIPQ